MTTAREIILDNTLMPSGNEVPALKLPVSGEFSAHVTIWMRSVESAWESPPSASLRPLKLSMSGADTSRMERVLSGYPPARWWEKLPHGLRAAVEAWIDWRDERSAAARYRRTAGARLSDEERTRLETSLRRRGWDAESSTHLDG